MYDGVTLKQKGVRIVSVQLPTPADANALLALADTTFIEVHANKSLSELEQHESIKRLLGGWKKLAHIKIKEFGGLAMCETELASHASSMLSLHLDHCNVNANVGSVIYSFHKLWGIELEVCGVDDAFVELLCQNCKTLTSMVLEENNLTNRSLSHIGTLEHLEDLYVGYSGVSNEDAEKFVGDHKDKGWVKQYYGRMIHFSRPSDQASRARR